MTTYPNLGLTLPTRGVSGAGVWDDVLDGDIALIDAHDHSSGKGLRITPSAIDINADLPFSSLYAPTQLHRVSFSAIAAGALTGSHNKSLFVSDGTSGLSAGELYWRNSSGNNVKLTSGNTLNVAGFVGGIGGDYQSVGARLNFDDSAKRYTLQNGTADSFGWARVAAGGLRLFEFNTTESVHVEQLCPAGLASTYQMTWPTALPGAQAVQQISSAGQIIWSNTITGAVTISAGGAAITGNSSVTGNFSVTGTLTFGDVETYSVAYAIAGTGATGPSTGGTAGAVPAVAVGTGTNGAVNLPLRMRVGTTITAWEVRLIKNTDNTKTLSAKLWKGITPTQIGVTQSSNANAPGLITLGQSSLSEVVTSSTGYFIEIVGSGTSGDIVTHYYQVTTA